MLRRDILTRDKIGPVVYNIIISTCNYLKDNPGIESLILGMSGGADSALVAILAKAVQEEMMYDEYGNRDIKLIFRSLPIKTNTAHERSRAMMLGKLLTKDFQEVDLSTEYDHIASALYHEETAISAPNSFSYKVRLGNIKARIRMIYLYNIASLNKGMVLSTDNFSELLLGFWTLHGDVGDFGMIQNLWKTEVFLMLDHLADKITESGEMHEDIPVQLRQARLAVPTDGLGITASDMEQFGDAKSYEEVDLIFLDALKNGFSKFKDGGIEMPKVLKMYKSTMYKRNNPHNIPRGELLGLNKK